MVVLVQLIGTALLFAECWRKPTTQYVISLCKLLNMRGRNVIQS
jgi:hypothetical protein